MRTHLLWFGLALASCSSMAITPGDGGDAGDGGGGGDGTTLDAARSPCPSMPPSAGASCSRAGLQCSWGTDPRAGCRTQAQCESTGWQLTPPNCAPESCPSAAPMDQSSCDGMGAICSFTDGSRCNCAPCPPGGPACQPGPLRWFCNPAPSDPNCPTQMPNQGDACATNGTTCDYGACRGGWNLQCQNGIWVNQPAPCPG